MSAKTEIIVEIGYNHLGSPYLLKNIMEIIIKSKLNVTFQIKSLDYKYREILEINLDYLLDSVRFYKKKYPNSFKVGFALDSSEYIEKISEISDFIKLLSIFSNKEDFLEKTNYKKPIFVSLGLNSTKEIQIISKACKKNNIKFNSIYTTFDSSGFDISLEEINFIEEYSDTISFGYHQKNIFIIPTISSLFSFNKIFVYLNPGFDENFHKCLPDAEHSVNFDEILKIRETFNWKNIIIKNRPRGSFKDFTND